MKMHTKQGYFSVVALLIVVLAPYAGAQLRVVTTTADLKCLTEAVGGDLVTVSSLGTGREDVHFLAAKPSFMVQANRADLWIRQGLELEIGFEPLILEGARNPDIHVGRRGHLDASQGVSVLDVPTVPVDRSMGDVHPMGDPHYHMDPFNARIMAKNIHDRLVDLDPANADVYTQNLARFLDRLDRAMFGADLVETMDAEHLWALHEQDRLDAVATERDIHVGGWVARMKPHRGARLVTYHRSWRYFTSRFGLDIVDELEPKPGIPPSPRHLARVVERMNALEVPVILMEPFYSRRAPELVAERTGAVVLQAGNMVGSEAAAPDYISMIDNIVHRLTATLEGRP